VCVVRLLSRRSPNSSFLLGIPGLSSVCTDLVTCFLAPVCGGELGCVLFGG